jgi:bacterioferritin
MRGYGELNRAAGEAMTAAETKITREDFIDALNEDLSREYQAIISYVNYSQLLKGAAYMNIADELAVHAKEELDHALQISKQVAWAACRQSRRSR